VLIYCDSVILIYFLDKMGALSLRAVNRLGKAAAAGDRIVISDLVRLECRVKPIQRGDAKQLAAFDGFFVRSDVDAAPLTAAVFDRATNIRARHGFKTIDAVNLAAAVEYRCDRFLTNDTRLARFSDIPVEILP
jgi:uncharacterized protein